MKRLFVSLILLAGLVVVVKAVSNQRTNGKLNIGDPLPAATAEDQDGNLVQLSVAGNERIHTGLFLSKGDDSRMHCSGLQFAGCLQ